LMWGVSDGGATFGADAGGVGCEVVAAVGAEAAAEAGATSAGSRCDKDGNDCEKYCHGRDGDVTGLGPGEGDVGRWVGDAFTSRHEEEKHGAGDAGDGAARFFFALGLREDFGLIVDDGCAGVDQKAIGLVVIREVHWLVDAKAAEPDHEEDCE